MEAPPPPVGCAMQCILCARRGGHEPHTVVFLPTALRRRPRTHFSFQSTTDHFFSWSAKVAMQMQPAPSGRACSPSCLKATGLRKPVAVSSLTRATQATLSYSIPFSPYMVVSITAKPSISTSVSFWKKPETSKRAIAG